MFFPFELFRDCFSSRLDMVKSLALSDDNTIHSTTLSNLSYACRIVDELLWLIR
jgi:hypothetical protein